MPQAAPTHPRRPARPRRAGSPRRARRQTRSTDVEGDAPTPDRRERRVTEPFRAWLDVLDVLLTGVEQTAWQIREVAERTAEAVDGTRDTFSQLRSRGEPLQRQAARLPQKLTRLSSTAWVLTQIIASYRLLPTREAFVSASAGTALREAVHARNAERLRALCERQGGALLKVGQMLSSRPDLLPAVWCETLEALQDDAPVLPFDAIRAVLARELPGPVEAHFAWLDPAPVAAASIGQVHRGRLHDGREVAVKVQRPGIEELVELDLELLRVFLDACRDALPPLDHDTVVSEVQAMIAAELDYGREAQTTEAVAAMFEGHGRIRVPHVVTEVSTQRVLVTEWMAGEKISRVLARWHAAEAEGETAAGDRTGAALGLVMQAYFVQILEHGLFQADPHPGNLLLAEDGQLVLLDFGCAKRVPEPARVAYIELVQAFFVRDHGRIAELLAQVGLRTRSGQVQSLQRFTTTVLAEFDRAREAGGWPQQAQVLASAAALLGEIQDDPVVHMPQDFVMLGRVFATLGGMFMAYQPRIDAARDLLPLLSRLTQATQKVRKG